MYWDMKVRYYPLSSVEKSVHEKLVNLRKEQGSIINLERSREEVSHIMYI
jgi:hypothetical protein